MSEAPVRVVLDTSAVVAYTKGSINLGEILAEVTDELLADIDPATITLDAPVSPLAAMNDQLAPAPGMPSIVDWLRDRLEDDRLTKAQDR